MVDPNGPCSTCRQWWQTMWKKLRRAFVRSKSQSRGKTHWSDKFQQVCAFRSAVLVHLPGLPVSHLPDPPARSLASSSVKKTPYRSKPPCDLFKVVGVAYLARVVCTWPGWCCTAVFSP